MNHQIKQFSSWLPVTVMHQRSIPNKNTFSYQSLYVVLPWCEKSTWPIPHNRWGLFAFYDKNHGERNSTSPAAWAKAQFSAHGIEMVDHTLILITMPRVLGYTFNPVSFWLCLDASQALIAYLCEVNNTFGETHTYICVKPDRSPIKKTDCLQGAKQFHVSPFLARKGDYTFRIDWQPAQSFRIWINYYNEKGDKQLITYMGGHLSPAQNTGPYRYFLKYPFSTLKVIMLIHWQALKLLFKRIRYIKKPTPLADPVSTVDTLKKHDLDI